MLYLPLSTLRNAEDFITILAPSKVVFVKYDLWYHYIHVLNRERIPLFLTCALFRNSQWYFSFAGTFLREELKLFQRIFTLDHDSAEVLQQHQFINVVFAGDTRCDRVIENRKTDFNHEKIIQFVAGKKILVCGSTWPEDEKVLHGVLPYLLSHHWKIMIAPHDISTAHLRSIQQRFGAALFSEDAAANADCLLIDTIGMLKYLYRYATVAYVGGAFRQGLHNILEAAVYDKPVIFGPEFSRYPEAVALREEGGAFAVKNAVELTAVFRQLEEDNQLQKSGKASGDFVLQHAGAAARILPYLA